MPAKRKTSSTRQRPKKKSARRARPEAPADSEAATPSAAETSSQQQSKPETAAEISSKRKSRSKPKARVKAEHQDSPQPESKAPPKKKPQPPRRPPSRRKAKPSGPSPKSGSSPEESPAPERQAPAAPRRPAERLTPFVIVNMAMSADGKIAGVHRKITKLGSSHDQEALLELRATADAVMAGARTVDADKVTMGPGDDKYRQARVNAGLREYNLRIIVSGAGTINTDAEIFRHRFSPIILLTTERISRLRLKEIAPVMDHIKVLGCNAVDFTAALKWLRAEWGVKRLVVEGGGDLNFALFRENLVDELRLTVCPMVLGGQDAATIADGIGLERLMKATRFKLAEKKLVDQEMFLVYRKAELMVDGNDEDRRETDLSS